MLEEWKNKLLVFEAQDHSGKTTLAKKLNEHLNENNIKSVYTFQPGDIQYGQHAEILNNLCKKKTYNLDPLSNLFAFLLDRSENTSKFAIKKLEEGYTVISDRWWYSTIAYQFYGKQLLEKYNMDLTFAYWMNKLASHNLEPDKVFYLVREQMKVENDENDPTDLFESANKEFKNRVKQGYEHQFELNQNFIKIEVDDDIDVTLKRILDA